MADVLLRVKRKRDEEPARIIAIEQMSSNRLKKRKTLDSLMTNLSLSTTALAFKLKNPKYNQRAEQFMTIATPYELKQANQTLQHLNRKERIKATRFKTRQNVMRQKMFEATIGEDSWTLNGEKCLEYSGEIRDPESEFVEDWYELTEVEVQEADSAPYAIHFSDDEKLDSSEEESIDSEDSNREDHPYHDYPDEDEFDSEDEDGYDYKHQNKNFEYYVQSDSDSSDSSPF